MSDARPIRLLVVNTFNTTGLPLQQEILPRLRREGIEPRLWVARTQYRQQEAAVGDDLVRPVWTPRFVRRTNAAVHLCYALQVAWVLLFGRYDVILSFTQPPLFHLFVGLASRLRRKPLLFHVMDLYPDCLQAAGKLGRKGLLGGTLSRWSSRTWKRAQGLVVIGRCMADRLRARGVKSSRLQLSTNWSPFVAEYRKARPARFREAHDLQGKLLVLYAGNMGIGHEMRTLLEASRELRDLESLRFFLVGRGRRRAEVERFIAAEHPPNLQLLDHLPAEAFGDALAAADAHLITLRPEFDGLMVPSKFYSALASGKPIIYEGSAQGEVAREVEENGLGSRVDYRDTASLVATLRRFASDALYRQKLAENAAERHAGGHDPATRLPEHVELLARLIRGAVQERVAGSRSPAQVSGSHR